MAIFFFLSNMGISVIFFIFFVFFILYGVQRFLLTFFQFTGWNISGMSVTSYYLSSTLSEISNLILNKNNVSYSFVLFYLFLFIFVLNILSLVPFFYSLTTLIFIVFFLSFTFLFGNLFLGLKSYGVKFLGGFLPSGAPFEISIFLVLMELISYSMRAVSLPVRLIANMLSGHMLLKILLTMAWTVLNSFFVTELFVFPFVMSFLVLCLEVVVCALQAYVFTMLSTIYLNEALNFISH